jgi:hypothetical protein
MFLLFLYEELWCAKEYHVWRRCILHHIAGKDIADEITSLDAVANNHS